MPRDIDFEALRQLRTAFGVTYPAGYEIFRQGRRGADFYVILEGEVVMLIHDGRGETEVAVLHAGDFFGEMAVFRNERRSATARTRAPTSVLYFNAATATELFLASPRFAFGIIRTLCDRVGALDHEIVVLKRALADHRRREAEAGLTAILHDTSAAAAAADPDAPPRPVWPP
jgi:CRP-like cAMP-binding protein